MKWRTVLIEKQMLNYLKAYKKKKIKLIELEKILASNVTYDKYASIILKWLDKGYIRAVVVSGFNHKSINLPNEFYIESKKINEPFYLELEQHALKFSDYFKIDYYFRHAEIKWEEDKDYISQIYEYLVLNDYPVCSATNQERSYDICGDEKWLDYNGGMKLLSQLGIKEKLLLQNQNEPAMFAIHPDFVNYNVYKHLIVENKAVYYRLLPLLKITSFSTLIYGAGWRIMSCIKDFRKQFPFEGIHHFYYFGDIDHEGIKIYKSVNEILDVSLAIPFYIKLLEQNKSTGKENQKKDIESVNFFLKNLTTSYDLIALLDKKHYWPQEGLRTKHLKDAWEQLDAN